MEAQEKSYTALTSELRNISTELKEIIRQLGELKQNESTYLRVDSREFVEVQSSLKLIRTLVFGFVGVVLMTVIGALLALVIIRPSVGQAPTVTVQPTNVTVPAHVRPPLIQKPSAP